MPDREKIAFAVYLVLVRGDEVLMLRRANTGWQDGNYSLVAGHVDAGETATSAMARETFEEAGVQVQADQLRLVHAMHRRDRTNYLDLYFLADRWQGEPTLQEHDKADDLGWFPLSQLPENTIASVKLALRCFRDGHLYSEHGWGKLGASASRPPVSTD